MSPSFTGIEIISYNTASNSKGPEVLYNNNVYRIHSLAPLKDYVASLLQRLIGKNQVTIVVKFVDYEDYMKIIEFFKGLKIDLKLALQTTNDSSDYLSGNDSVSVDKFPFHLMVCCPDMSDPTSAKNVLLQQFLRFSCLVHGATFVCSNEFDKHFAGPEYHVLDPIEIYNQNSSLRLYFPCGVDSINKIKMLAFPPIYNTSTLPLFKTEEDFYLLQELYNKDTEALLHKLNPKPSVKNPLNQSRSLQQYLHQKTGF